MDSRTPLDATGDRRGPGCDPPLPRGGGGRRNTSPGWTRLRAPTPSNKARTRAAPPRATRINYRRAPPGRVTVVPRRLGGCAPARAPRPRPGTPDDALSLSAPTPHDPHVTDSNHPSSYPPPAHIALRSTDPRACPWPGVRPPINVSLCVALFPPSPPPHRHLRNRRHFATTEIGLRCSPRSPRSSRRAPARRSFP